MYPIPVPARRLAALWSVLPPRTLLIVATGAGDTAAYSRWGQLWICVGSGFVCHGSWVDVVSGCPLEIML